MMGERTQREEDHRRSCCYLYWRPVAFFKFIRHLEYEQNEQNDYKEKYDVDPLKWYPIRKLEAW